METSTLSTRPNASTLINPKILVPAIGSAFAKLDPRLMVKNPVMFVVEVVAALTTVLFLRDLVDGRREHRLHVPDHPVAVVHGAVCQLRRSRSRRARQGAGGSAAPPRTETQAKLLTGPNGETLQDRGRQPASRSET